MLKWLKLVLMYLYPCDAPEDDPADATDPAASIDPDAPDADPDDGTTGDDAATGSEPGDDEPRGESRAQKRIRELNERLQASNRQLEDERRRNAAAQPAPRAAVDADFEREEARLRDPQCTDWERWQIQSNRTLRSNRAESQQAVAIAADAADRAAYMTEALKKPLMARYQDRVEARFQELRAQGRGAPRKAIYLFMLGEDVDKAKPKAKTKEESTPAKPAGPTEAQRGKPVGRRADVTGKAQQTEREKRRARLEGVNI